MEVGKTLSYLIFSHLKRRATFTAVRLSILN